MTRYRYALLVLRTDGTAVGQLAIEPDWEPAVEWARLQRLRCGADGMAPADDVIAPNPVIEPLWHDAGAPFVRGFRVSLATRGDRRGTTERHGSRIATELHGSRGATGRRGPRVATGEDHEAGELGLDFLRDVAAGVAGGLVEDGRLARGEGYRYAVAAFSDDTGDGDEASASRQAFVIEELPWRAPTLDASLVASLRGAVWRAADTTAPAEEKDGVAAHEGAARAAGANSEEIEEEDEIGDGDPTVLLPRQVLEESATLTRATPGVETGGILIGHLRRDRTLGEILVEITAQVPARHTRADAKKLTFTADTWTDARAALELRGRGELLLGWWHSHPVGEWCKECPLVRQPDCALARGFLSADDRALHRAVFPRAYSVALVASDVAFGDVSFSLFGWRRGRIARRGFFLGQGAELPISEAVRVAGDVRSSPRGRVDTASLPAPINAAPRQESRR